MHCNKLVLQLWLQLLRKNPVALQRKVIKTHLCRLLKLIVFFFLITLGNKCFECKNVVFVRVEM